MPTIGGQLRDCHPKGLAFRWIYYYRLGMDDIIIKLQTIVGHQDEDIANLSKELYTQQQEIHKLKQQMSALIDRVRSLLDATQGSSDKTPEPPPPHY